MNIKKMNIIYTILKYIYENSPKNDNILVTNYFSLMSIFNSLNGLDINNVSSKSDNYTEIIYMYLFFKSNLFSS